MPSAFHNSRIKPRALRPGDKVGIVAPASNVNREMLEAGCDGLRRVGGAPHDLLVAPETIVQPKQEVTGTVTIFGLPWNDRLSVSLSDGGRTILLHR